MHDHSKLRAFCSPKTQAKSFLVTDYKMISLKTCVLEEIRYIDIINPCNNFRLNISYYSKTCSHMIRIRSNVLCPNKSVIKV